MPPTAPKTEQFAELVEQFIRLRPNVFLPDHLVRFKQKMEGLRNGGSNNWEDYTFLFRILIILANSETPPTMGELSASLKVPFSTATRIVDWLVRGDLVTRVSDPNDRRIVRVQMTGTGHQLYQASSIQRRERIERLLGRFTEDEQEQLLRLTTKLLDSLLKEEDNGEGI